MKVLYVLCLLMSLTVLTSCSDEKNEQNSIAKKKKVVSRVVDPRIYSAGQKLFQVNCANCHGLYGEGAKNWRKPDEHGKNPAPPLNGTGHTWHHSNQALTNTIRNGTAKVGGNMPAWKDKLNANEIEMILIWVKAQWPDEIYTAWYNRFQQTK